MSSGSFLDGLGGFDLAGLLAQLRQPPQGFTPQADAAAAPAGLNPFVPSIMPTRGAGDVDPSGRGIGPVDQRRPSIAMNEDQAQALERAQAGPQDLAALGGSPVDRLLFDRFGMGGGPNAFTGSADPYGSRAVPLPPSRPSDDALTVQPTATGSVSATNPGGAGAPQSQVVASSTYHPDLAPNTPPGGRPNAAADLRGQTGDFDPLTGTIISGTPRPVGGQQAPASPFGGVPGTPGQSSQPVQPVQPGQGGPQQSLMEKFAQGLNNPDLSNLLMNVSIGLLTNRGIPQGIGAGLQGYQQSRLGDVKSQLQMYQLQQQMQQQNATRAYLRGKGLSPDQVEAATLNPAILSSVQAQMNKDPQTFNVGGHTFLGRPDQPQETWKDLGETAGPPSGYRPGQNGELGYIPGGPEDPAVKERNARAVATDKEQTPLLDIEARRKVGIPDNDTRAAWADPNGKVTFNDGPPPLAARPGQTFYDRGTLKPILTAPAAKPDGFDTETKLRGEFSKQLGSFADVHDGYGRLIAATKQRQENPGSVSPASDISLVFGYMKMLDPGSVVREGEYATAKNAAGVPERVLNAYNKALTGEFLSDTQRKDFLNQASELYGTARKTAEGVADRYRNLATSYGADPSRAVYLPEMPIPPKLGQQSQAPAGGAAARYQALIQGGMSKADAFAQMHKEGL